MGGGLKGGGGVSLPSMPNIGNLLNYANIQPSQYEQQLANISNNLMLATEPIRQNFLQDWQYFMRPPGFTGLGQGTQGTTTTTTTPKTTTSTSSNVPIPPIVGREQITNELNQYLNPINTQVRDSAYDWFGQNKIDLSKYGVSNTPAGMGAVNPSAGYSTDQIANISKSISDDLRYQQLADAIGNQAVGQSSTTTMTTPGSSGNLTPQSLYNPYNLPGYAPLYQLARTGLESQYNPARENIMASTPRGGALYNSLANLEMSKAQQAGSLPATIAAPLIQDIMNKAYATSWGQPQVSLGGLSSAAGNYRSGSNAALGSATSVTNAYLGAQQQAAMMNAAMQQQSKMGMGQGLGSLAGMGLKGAFTPLAGSTGAPTLAGLGATALGIL